MTKQELERTLRPYLGHTYKCTFAVGGGCVCGFEAMLRGLNKRHEEHRKDIKRIVEELEVNGFGSADLDDDVHDAASQEASNTNNSGMETQVAFLLERDRTPSVLEAAEHMGGGNDE